MTKSEKHSRASTAQSGSMSEKDYNESGSDTDHEKEYSEKQTAWSGYGNENEKSKDSGEGDSDWQVVSYEEADADNTADNTLEVDDPEKASHESLGSENYEAVIGSSVDDDKGRRKPTGSDAFA